MEEVVKLHGISYNLFTYRVIWGLKLKGIPFEYIEEEHSDKSPFILQHNPVFKSFPVLFHRPPTAKPICDSMVILEYIDQTWPHNPLLPTHPYRRAVARFWAKFAHDRGQCIGRMYYSTGEEQAKAIEETLEMLRIVEEGPVGEERFMCGGETVGMVDLAFAVIPQWLEVIEDVVGLNLPFHYVSTKADFGMVDWGPLLYIFDALYAVIDFHLGGPELSLDTLLLVNYGITHIP
nr:probable glutathione S-transferase [Ipomoea batatas]